MRSLIIHTIFSAIAFFTLAFAPYYWWSNKNVDQRYAVCPETISQIQQDSELESLRQFSLECIQDRNHLYESGVDVINKAVQAISIICLAAGICILMNFLVAFKTIRKMQGRLPSWLKWL